MEGSRTSALASGRFVLDTDTGVVSRALARGKGLPILRIRSANWTTMTLRQIGISAGLAAV